MTATDTAYDAAIKYASDLGAEHGRNAVDWWLQDALRSTRDGVAIRRILAGIEDGDPAVLDTFPAPDLSGQWADGLLPRDLVADALAAGGSVDNVEAPEWWDDICDAYETAFSTAVEDEITRAAREVLA